MTRERTREAPVTAVQESLRRRGWLRLPLYLLLLLVFLVGIAGTLLGARLLWQVSQHRTPHYPDIVEHFKYGSIGAEPYSGIPYRIWQALPKLFPDEFKGRNDYSAFGFLYENGTNGAQRDVPVGIARRVYRGVEVVWFNCATCHTGTVNAPAAGGQPSGRHIVPGMPSNNLDLHRFVAFLLEAGADERLSPDRLIPAMNETGPRLGLIEKALYRHYIIPMLREGLVLRRSRLVPLLAQQPSWGPGRVDTFNPYKLIQAKMPLRSLEPNEIVGSADFPSIFMQGPREGMNLHWDGNNKSLAERNLSAAMGAGVTPDSVDHEAIGRVAKWLLDLRPPPSPHQPEAAAVARGRDIYMRACAACHGYQSEQGYVFRGETLGQVEPNAKLGVDPHRLDSYTERFRAVQLSEFFKGTDYQFKEFKKTDGYANAPLDGLWLRAPYLHNGAVPTLADLLEPPEKRPQTFVRGIDTVDAARGGFVAPPCGSAPLPDGAFCFDTRAPGNGNGGHLYGTDLGANEKSDLLAYLLTF
jgi:mono/diheme cytochrome c family protein